MIKYLAPFLSYPLFPSQATHLFDNPCKLCPPKKEREGKETIAKGEIGKENERHREKENES
jgi:hypothetical protein